MTRRTDTLFDPSPWGQGYAISSEARPMEVANTQRPRESATPLPQPPNKPSSVTAQEAG